MATVFRKIRNSLIGEGKIGKYFTYALGEILLVMIGILLALQVDTWNSNNQDIERVDNFKTKLNTQLDQNITKIDTLIGIVTAMEKQTKSFYPIIGSGYTENLETQLNYLVAICLFDYDLGLDLNVILDARENGDLALIKSDELRHSIYSIISANDHIIERERIANADLNQQFMPYLNQNFNLINLRHDYVNQDLSTSKIYKGDNYKVLADQKFENYIFGRINFIENLKENYLGLKSILESTKTLVTPKS